MASRALGEPPPQRLRKRAPDSRGLQGRRGLHLEHDRLTARVAARQVGPQPRHTGRVSGLDSFGADPPFHPVGVVRLVQKKSQQQACGNPCRAVKTEAPAPRLVFPPATNQKKPANDAVFFLIPLYSAFGAPGARVRTRAGMSMRVGRGLPTLATWRGLPSQRVPLGDTDFGRTGLAKEILSMPSAATLERPSSGTRGEGRRCRGRRIGGWVGIRHWTASEWQLSMLTTTCG